MCVYGRGYRANIAETDLNSTNAFSKAQASEAPKEWGGSAFRPATNTLSTFTRNLSAYDAHKY